MSNKHNVHLPTEKVKSSTSQFVHTAVLISDSVALSQAAQIKLQEHGHGATVSHGVPVYLPAYNGNKLNCLVTEANEQLGQVHTRPHNKDGKLTCDLQL